MMRRRAEDQVRIAVHDVGDRSPHIGRLYGMWLADHTTALPRHSNYFRAEQAGRLWSDQQPGEVRDNRWELDPTLGNEQLLIDEDGSQYELTYRSRRIITGRIADRVIGGLRVEVCDYTPLDESAAPKPTTVHIREFAIHDKRDPSAYGRLLGSLVEGSLGMRPVRQLATDTEVTVSVPAGHTQAENAWVRLGFEPDLTGNPDLYQPDLVDETEARLQTVWMHGTDFVQDFKMLPIKLIFGVFGIQVDRRPPTAAAVNKLEFQTYQTSLGVVAQRLGSLAGQRA